MTLDQLPPHQTAFISDINGDDPELEAKLREIGFAEDDEIELVERGPLQARPLCFRLNQTLIALRPEEAVAIHVDFS